MTDIEKLAATLEKQLAKLGPFAHELRAGTIKRAIGDLGIAIDDAVGLIEGTHVVVPVEPTGKAWDNYWNSLPVKLKRRLSIEDFRNLGDIFLRAMIKAAQEDL